jgi:hypothetical protein
VVPNPTSRREAQSRRRALPPLPCPRWGPRGGQPRSRHSAGRVHSEQRVVFVDIFLSNHVHCQIRYLSKRTSCLQSLRGWPAAVCHDREPAGVGVFFSSRRGVGSSPPRRDGTSAGRSGASCSTQGFVKCAHICAHILISVRKQKKEREARLCLPHPQEIAELPGRVVLSWRRRHLRYYYTPRAPLPLFCNVSARLARDGKSPFWIGTS